MKKDSMNNTLIMFYSITSLFLSLRILYLVRFNQTLGSFWYILKQLMKDITYFLLFMGIIIMANSHAMYLGK